MIRRPPRSTPKPSSAASDVYKRQFFASADRLGDYVLLDYVDRKRRASR